MVAGLRGTTKLLRVKTLSNCEECGSKCRHFTRVCFPQLNSWAVHSAEVMSHGDLKISYQTSKCLPNSAMSCVEAVMVDLRHNDSSLSITVDRQFHVTVNGRLIPDSNSLQFSLRQGQVNVKRVSSLYMTITGFSFRILYDANGKIYVTMEPFYSRRVTILTTLQSNALSDYADYCYNIAVCGFVFF